MPETNEAEDLSDCYVAEEERVLDPSLVDKSVIERLPQPTGWRILIAPFKPAQKSKGGILLSPKTIEEDVVQGTWFESYEHLQKELTEYLYYYNHERPHMGIDGKTPAQINQNCQRIT